MLRTLVFSSLIFACFLFVLFNFDIISLNIIKHITYIDKYHNPYYHMFFGLTTLIILSFVIKQFKSNLYLYSWYIKLIVALFIGGYFEFLNIGLDQYNYYDNAVLHLFEQRILPGTTFVTDEQRILPGTSFVTYINHLLSICFGGSFYSLKVANTFISFMGLVLLYKLYLLLNEDNIRNQDPQAYGYFIFLLPSVLLWTSLLGKDSLILFTSSLFIFSFIKFNLSQKKVYLGVLILSLLLSYYIRPWMVLIMIGSISIYYFIYMKLKYKIVISILSLSAILAFEYIATMNVLNLINSENIFIRLGEIQQSFSRGSTAQELPLIRTFGDYIYYYLPNLFISLFMPLPFLSTNSLFMWFFSIENLFVLIGSIYAIFHIKYILHNKLLVFLFIFIFCWSLIYVILSPGNLGTALRYKAQVWPLIIIIILVTYSYNRSLKGRMSEI